METWLAIKLAHITFALVSISFFMVRAIWSVFESPLLQKIWVKVLPHIVDTLLLASAIYLIIASSQYPFQQHWLTAKLLALVVYILLGTMAIKRGKTALQRGVFALLAIAVFGYMLAVAFYRSPLFF